MSIDKNVYSLYCITFVSTIFTYVIACQVLVTNAGIERDIIDVGWPAAAAVAFATDVGLWVIPIALIVNIVLLIPGVTKTLNVDIWNFWHYAFTGSLVTAATGSLPLGLATGCSCIYALSR
ncbi:MAG: PTS transporter subunit IIC [Chloroflexota bacterium]